LLQTLFFVVVVRPLVLLFIGLNVRRRQLIPKGGPAIVCANHNSHLDTLVVMSLFPLHVLHKIRPVAAADYWQKNKFLAWFSSKIMNVIPINRKKTGTGNPLEHVEEALARGEIVLIFPEGTRGEPERLASLRKGVARLAEKFPEAPVSPIYLRGLGKALPRGEGILVPFFCDVFVGKPFCWSEVGETFMSSLSERMTTLSQEGYVADWQ
jgi:1-acyl-sn-glycerol-3-phosphate acyltransferase